METMSFADRDEMLAAYAMGTTSPGLSLLCAAHVSMRPEAGAFVGAFEELGGALLADERGASMRDGALDALMSRIDAPSERDAATVDDEPAPRATIELVANGEVRVRPTPPCGVASPIADLLDGPLETLKWRPLIPGIAEYVFEEFEDERVSLLRGRPGARALKHTHTGSEATLVLAGALKDGDQVFTAGDVSICGRDHDHRPQIVGDETCYCLVVTNGAIHLTGRLTRALNLFQ